MMSGNLANLGYITNINEEFTRILGFNKRDIVD